MGKSLTSIILLLLTLPCFVFAKENYPKGLREATAEHKQRMRAEYKQIHRVFPNELGLKRINEYRRQHGLAPIDTPPRKKGEEADFISSSGATLNIESTGDTSFDTLATTAIPGTADNSLLPAFPLIASQGVLNSCVAFSSTYYQMTHNVGLLTNVNNKNTDLVNKFSTKFVYNMINGGADNGSYAYNAFRVLQYHGAPMLSQWPYDANYRAWPTTADVWKSAMTYRVSAVQTVSGLDSSTGLTNLKAILNNGYVVTVATWIDSWQYGVIKNDPATTYDDLEVGKNAVTAVNGKLGGHMMTVVGYNDHLWLDLNNNNIVDAGEKGALRLANSWGTGWQDQGYVWVTYDSLKNLSAVAGVTNVTGRTQFSQDNSAYHFIPQIITQKKLIAELTLSHAKRNQLMLRYGVGSLASASATTFVSPGILQNQGGAYAFDGSTTEMPMTVALDISDLAGAVASAQKYYFEVNDTTSGDSVQLRDIRITDQTGRTIVANETVYPNSFDSAKKTYYSVSFYNDGTQTQPPTPGSLNIIPDLSSPTSSLSLTWQDLASNESGYVLEQSLDGVNYFSIKTLGANSTSTVVSGLNPNSLSYYRLMSANGAGYSLSAQKAGQTAAPDTTSPAVSLTFIKGSKTISFTANTSDSSGIAKVEFWLDGKLYSTDTSANYTSSVTLRNLSAGTHQMMAKSFDKVGNVGTATVSFVK